MGITLKEKYGMFFAEMVKHTRAAEKIDDTKVYEEANVELKQYALKILSDCTLPGSGLGNIENFKAFYDAVTKEGKSGVIFVEHYSNLDLPGFLHLLENCGEEWGKDFSSRIVAIAGMKLNESGLGVRLFAECFSRVIVYPTRSLTALEGKLSPEEYEAESQRARKINFAAMRQMDQCKKRGQIILVFPSGTRYRPGHPETKTGLREIDSYMRLFDVMLCVGLNGNSLTINPENPDDMLADIVEPDVLRYTASPVITCKEFRNNVLASLPEDCPDPKVETVAAVMKVMDDIHEEVEKTRLKK